MKRVIITILSLMLFGTSAFPAGKQGGLVLQFDDGWTSWVTVIAPEIKQAGGVASGFVNNQNIRSGRISREDLLTLQNTYHWEIGTHTWHHLNAPGTVRKTGIAAWLDQEVIKSKTELQAMGLTVRSLVFPFNAYTPDLASAVSPLVESFRRSDLLALADGISPDKSVPGTAIDMAHYVPTPLIMKWIDMASERQSLLFLYGHRVLPDSSFVTGVVVSVTTTTLTAQLPVSLPEGSDFVLVPDMTRRPVTPDYFHVTTVTGNLVEVDRPDLTAHTKPGASFMIGEAYSTRLSDFRTILNYAAEHMNFYTLHDVVEEKHRKTSEPRQE